MLITLDGYECDVETIDWPTPGLLRVRGHGDLRGCAFPARASRAARRYGRVVLVACAALGKILNAEDPPVRRAKLPAGWCAVRDHDGVWRVSGEVWDRLGEGWLLPPEEQRIWRATRGR